MITVSQHPMTKNTQHPRNWLPPPPEFSHNNPPKKKKMAPPPRNGGSRNTVQNILEAGSAQADATYAREWALYTKWVDENYDNDDVLEEFDLDPPPGVDGGICYITRANLDAYFQNVVVHRTGTRATIKRIEQALKYFAESKENRFIGADVAGSKFTSRVMTAAINAQQVEHKRRGSVEHLQDDKCPHRFCKHTLSTGERTKIVKAAMESHDWASAIVAVNLGHNVALRGASTRLLTLCDLRLATGYGPSSNKLNGNPQFDRTLMIILRKGPVHKDRFKNVKQVGMWRHNKWLLDPNFSIALAVIHNLRTAGDAISFCVQQSPPTSTARPLWWDRKLISWNTLKGSTTAVSSSVLLVIMIDLTFRVPHLTFFLLLLSGFYY